MTVHLQGYAEGYYGKLLSWSERLGLLDTLAANGQNTYYYAPKEDPAHRWQWREAYTNHWREQFSTFCKQARQRGISVVAGVAPGLDFDFTHLPDSDDFRLLIDKCRQLLADGADQVSLLMDDIDADFATRSGGISSEGHAHARLANELSQQLGCALWVTPRIYANELASGAVNYLPDFIQTLDEHHIVLYCGADIVSATASVDDIRQMVPDVPHRLVLWDNLYANDYCPQRLFVGPWQGREEVSDVLLNPTGMYHTDTLLLDVMARTLNTGHSAEAQLSAWQEVLENHRVPQSFLSLAPYLYHPVFNGVEAQALPAPTPAVFEAIEECLWRWKSPLSREWYAPVFGLKLELLISEKRMSELRLRKTQSEPLARTLLHYDHVYRG